MNPIKPSLKTEWLSWLLLTITAAVSYYFYHHFPAVVPTHWNVAGNPDNWGSGKTNAIAIPLVILGMYVMFLALPYLDPKKERYEQFAKTYHIFKAMLIGFMLAIYVVTGLSILGYPISVGVAVPGLIGLLFIVLGNYMGKLKMNWFVGIKTPWTLSSEEVWNKTHRFSGKIFMISGVLMMLQGVMPLSLRIPLFVVMILMILFGSFGYSYYIYKKVEKK
jgi:uncharacterized membrane protein